MFEREEEEGRTIRERRERVPVSHVIHHFHSNDDNGWMDGVFAFIGKLLGKMFIRTFPIFVTSMRVLTDKCLRHHGKPTRKSVNWVTSFGNSLQCSVSPAACALASLLNLIKIAYRDLLLIKNITQEVHIC